MPALTEIQGATLQWIAAALLLGIGWAGGYLYGQRRGYSMLQMALAKLDESERLARDVRRHLSQHRRDMERERCK